MFERLLDREPDIWQYRAVLQTAGKKIAAGEINLATGRDMALEALQKLKFKINLSGPIEDFTSEAHLNAVLDGISGIIKSSELLKQQTESTLYAFPAWKLIPFGKSATDSARNWNDRWNAAGRSVEWKGASRFMLAALKESPIWQALGNGAGGYEDALGNPFPPFAFGSTMDWQALSREETKESYIALSALPQKPRSQKEADELRRMEARLGKKFMTELNAEIDEILGKDA